MKSTKHNTLTLLRPVSTRSEHPVFDRTAYSSLRLPALNCKFAVQNEVSAYWRVNILESQTEAAGFIGEL